MTKNPTKRRVRRNASWKVEKVENTVALYRLVGPLSRQKGRQKTMCVAIGGKRLKALIDVLNEMGVEI